MKPDCYISVDIEADGPIPGPYSLVSLGACVAGVRSPDGTYSAADPDEQTFYAELAPISDDYDPEALAVSGISREHLVEHGEDPKAAMTRFCEWVADVAKERGARPVFAAYPASYDWVFVRMYIDLYSAAENPFGFSGVFDMKSAIAAKTGLPFGYANKRSLPKHLLSTRPHTHNALDDAQEQATLLSNLMTWDGSGIKKRR